MFANDNSKHVVGTLVCYGGMPTVVGTIREVEPATGRCRVNWRRSTMRDSAWHSFWNLQVLSPLEALAAQAEG